MNVCNVLSADEIVSSVKTFSGQREVHVSDSTGRYSLWFTGMFQKLVQTSLVYRTQRSVPL